ncbi:MAG: hypothetical protein IJ511_03340 [Bacteroides sp.]|nr:hypothetical protein [Bacteroides sp.]
MSQKLIRSLCLLLLLVGQFCPAMGQQVSSAREVMEHTTAALRKAGGVEACFNIRLPEGVTQGTICLKGEKFVLEAEGVKTWFDGHTQWSYLAANEEVNVTLPTPEELQAINPYALLALYRKGYDLKLDARKRLEGTPVYEVTMTAADARRDLQVMVLSVSRENYRPLQIRLTERGGTPLATITITSYRTGLDYPDSFFVFDARQYPDAEVIDLR